MLTLNGKPITPEELEEKKKLAETTKGVILIQEAPNKYKLVIQG